MGAKYGKHRSSGTDKSGSVFRPRFFSKDKDGSEKSITQGEDSSRKNSTCSAGENSPIHSMSSSNLRLGGSPTNAIAAHVPLPTSQSLQNLESVPPRLASSPKRGPSFSNKADKPAALFQKSLSQEGLVAFIRNESVTRVQQEAAGGGVAAINEEEEFAENPFLLRKAEISQNMWEIHVSDDDLTPTMSAVQVSTLAGYAMPVLDTAIHPSGALLATAVGSGEVDLYPLPLTASSAQRRRALSTMRGRFAVSCMAFSPDGALAATGGHDKGLRVWDVVAGGSGEPAASTFIHESAVTCVTFAPHHAGPGRPAMLASGGADKPNIFIWAVDPLAGGGGAGSFQLREICVFVGHWSWLTSLSFSPDGCSLASASQDGTIRVWDVECGEPVASMGFKSAAATVQHRSHLFKLGLRHVTLKDLEDALEGDGTETRYVWNGPAECGGEGEPVHLCKVQDLDGWGRFVESRFQYVDCASGEIIYTSSGWLQILRGHSGAVNQVAYSPDGRLIASAGQDGTVKIWGSDRLVNREVVVDDRFVEGTAGFHVISIEDEMTQSEDEPTVALITTDDGVFRYRLRFAQQGVFFDKGEFAADCTSGVGMMQRPKVGFRDRMRNPVYQIIRDSDSKVLFDWNFSTLDLRGHRAAVTCLAFVFGGQMVISSGADGTLRLWGLEDGLCRAVLQSAGSRRPAGSVSSLSLLLEPPMLAIADRVGQVHVLEGRALDPVLPHLFDDLPSPAPLGADSPPR